MAHIHERSERWSPLENKIFALCFTIVACVIIAYYFSFFLRKAEVYTHFFYIPILLAGMWYYRWTVYVACGLGVVHILVTHFSPLSLSIDVFGSVVIFPVVACVIGSLSEKRAQDEDALRAQDESYRTFFRTSRDPIFITSKEGRWIDFNDVTVELFGYENRDELREVRISDLYEDPEERKRHTRLIEQQGFTKEIAVNLRKKDGSIINTLITSVARKDENGNVIDYQGTIKDITELKQAEKELKKSRIKYLNLIENSADGIAVTERDGFIRFVNPVAEAIFGRTSEEFKGELFGFPIAVGRSTEIDTILRDGETGTGEMRVTETEWAGEPAYIISIRDITDRKRAEEKVKEAYRLREYFLKETSHRIITPVAIIGGCSQLLFESGNLDEDKKKNTDNT
jgi:PAS domain S-box-containing protein